MRTGLYYELDQRPVEAVVISSQLIFGSVGNNVIARLMERAGHRVVAVPTVILGNLPHYPSLAGGALDDSWFAGMLEALLERDVLTEARFVCVGYLAHPGQASIIAQWFAKLKTVNPGIRLIVDPAMGDDDVGLYTVPEVVEGYIEHLLPLATGITPNNFELGLLVKPGIEDVASRAKSLLGGNLDWVAVTSAPTDDADSGTICTLLVSEARQWQAKTSRVASRAKGAGDYFLGATVTGLLEGMDLEPAMEAAAHATSMALDGKDPGFSAR